MCCCICYIIVCLQHNQRRLNHAGSTKAQATFWTGLPSLLCCLKALLHLPTHILIGLHQKSGVRAVMPLLHTAKDKKRESITSSCPAMQAREVKPRSEQLQSRTRLS